MPLVVTTHGSEIADDQIAELETVIAQAMVAEAAAIGPEEAGKIPNTDEFGFLSPCSGKEDKGLLIEIYVYKRDDPNVLARYWQAVNEAIASAGFNGTVLLQGVPKEKWRGWLAPST